MQVFGTGYFCRCLSKSTSRLVDSCIDTYEVDAVEADRVPVLIDRPSDVEAICNAVIVRLVVNVSVIE